MTAPRLLIADDSPTARAALKAALVEQGYEVLEAEDGKQAVAAAAEHRPDLVLLDLEMPHLGGREVMAALRDDPELRDTPVIVLSTRTDPESVTGALRQGAHDYVGKPFEKGELAARVQGALRTRVELDDLRRRNSELTAFAWRASHDLKSPLAAIRGMADTVIAHEQLEGEVKRDLLARISAAAEQAATMVEGLLSLSREAESHPAVAARTPDPGAVVRDVVHQAHLPDVAWDSTDAGWAPVALPASDFNSVVQNLVVNASFYGRSDDGVLHLTVAARSEGRMLVMTVADQGRGVDPATVDRLFEPFVRGVESRKANPRSTGIGLAIVRRTVERWGGRVELVPSDQGARFVLELPLADAR
ncbi:MAG TPA: hybrid sensor histidine kinase/response regulator [Acidimicrobiales bacterium]|nr:hybrid sensor histidine kinase/response regulator [Acidimicrobiales bacterium]